VTKRIELSLTEGSPVMVHGDAAMLGVLLRNLVDNAVRYTPEGGKIAVTVNNDNGRAVLEVCDSGPGILPEEQGRVLERFYRGLGSEQSGSGLGLSIVKRIAQLHDAELYLGDGAEGKGLRVRVLLHTLKPDSLRPII
jgi:signal transduction histidine kinase